MRLQLAPEWKWIALDKCGQVYIYKDKPELKTNRWHTSIFFCLGGVIKVPDLGPWEDSLHEIRPDGSLKKYVPEMPVDMKVLVREDPTHDWEPRHFASWRDDGAILCWVEGGTSFTTTRVSAWPHWKLYEEEEK